MTIRLTHPRHGATYAYDETQLKFLTAQGWTPEVARVTTSPPHEFAPGESVAVIRKPGRPKKV